MQVCGPETRRENLSSSLTSDHHSFNWSPGLLGFFVILSSVILSSYSLTTRARDGQGRPGSFLCAVHSVMSKTHPGGTTTVMLLRKEGLGSKDLMRQC